MTPYKGIIKIHCKREKGGCLRNLREDVQPGCMDCPDALSQIVDLEGKVLFEYRSPEEKTGKRAKKAEGKKVRGSEDQSL